MKIYTTNKINLPVLQRAIRAAVVRISQQSDEVGTVSASEAERIVWEEIDKLMEAKP